MKRLAFALLLLAMPAAAQDGDLSIDAHRLGVMVDESDAALHAISPAWSAAQTTTDEDGDATAALISATRRFAHLQAQACRAKLMGPQFCAALYDPPWLNTRPANLRAALDDATTRIAAFWSDVCARAKTVSPNICVME